MELSKNVLVVSRVECRTGEREEVEADGMEVFLKAILFDFTIKAKRWGGGGMFAFVPTSGEIRVFDEPGVFVLASSISSFPNFKIRCSFTKACD